VRKLGAVPSTFAYRPPKANAADVADGLACQCKGKRHPVCLPAAKWSAWMTAVHAMLDRPMPRLGDVEQTEPAAAA
jgi:hypothetical protein